MFDLKELLISFDRHLITCLIANQVQGNATPHPGTVLSSFLHHLAQLILLFFLLLAAKVRSSCEEGPGQSALQSAYHDPKLDLTE